MNADSCPCPQLDDALTALERLTQTTELLSLRVDRLVSQARRAGLILPDAMNGDDLWGGSDLSRVMGLSRTRFYQLTRLPGFPVQVAPGLWCASAVIKWREDQAARWNGGWGPKGKYKTQGRG